MAISPHKDHYITSSADAFIAKHPFPSCKGIFKTSLKPIKIAATKHCGQQGLSYRSDARIFATAGWDSATRIYSGKSMKEVAVLKWHKEGCYATAFASVEAQSVTNSDKSESDRQVEGNATGVATSGASTLTVQQKRDQVARSMHWLAVGSKDGKVSLWDIF